jgi:hypothetical protein
MHLVNRQGFEAPKALQTLALLAVVAFTAGAAEAQSVTGTWILTVETPRGGQQTTLVLTQEGEAVTGTAEMRMGEAPVEGTVKGAQVELVVRVSAPRGDRTLEIRYEGTLEGDVIEGTVTRPPPPGRRSEDGPRGAPFRAVRQG